MMSNSGFIAASNSIYSATKATVRSLARTWATDLRNRIRVNAVSRDCIDTPGLSELLVSSETASKRFKIISNNVPLGSRGPRTRIAKAVVFLTPSDASQIIGPELFIAGGPAHV
jgi:NAD(P)-dependent dehydrogenase (short-subunit alcohol dehydrogenase family)